MKGVKGVRTIASGQKEKKSRFSPSTIALSRLTWKGEKEFEEVWNFFRHSVPCGLIMVTDSGKIVRTNESAQQMFQYSQKELEGQAVEMLIPRWYQNAHQKDVKNFGLHPQPRAMDDGRNPLGVKKNGEEFPVEIGLIPIQTPQRPAVVAYVVDISERSRVENEFRVASRQHQLILDSAGEGIYGLDLNGHATFVNPAAAQMIGCSQSELLGEYLHAVLHHSKVDGSPYPGEECPIYSAYRDGLVHRVEDEVFWRKDGTCFPVEYTSTPMWNEQGTLEGAVVTFRDVTAARATQRALRTNEERLHLILEKADLAFWDWNIQTGELDFDGKWEIFLGYKAHELPRKFDTWQKMIHKMDKLTFRSALDQHLQALTPLFDVEYRSRTKSGNLVWLNARGRIQEWNAKNKPVRMLGVIQLLTNQKRKEQILQTVTEMLSTGNSVSRDAVQEAIDTLKAQPSLDPTFTLEGLPPQQRAVLTLVAHGKTNKEISATLKVSTHTVRNHLVALYKKLHISRRSEAASVFTKLDTT